MWQPQRPTFIIHIGANKTGTSAIQQFLRDNVSQLAEFGFVVPDNEFGWGSDIGGEQIFAFERLFSSNDPEIQIAQIFDGMAISRPAQSTVLLSAENISNLHSAEPFRKAVSRHPSNVVLYIRRQDEHLYSSWQQWGCKTHKSFDDWLNDSIHCVGHWDAIIDTWESVVGRDNVIVRVFDRSSFVNSDVVRDFAYVIGLYYLERFNISRRLINPSPNPILSSLVSGNTRIFSDIHDNRFFHILPSGTATIGSNQGQISLMSREQRDSILAYFHAQNDRICRSRFPERSSLFEDVDHSKYIYLNQSEIFSEQIRVLTETIHELNLKINDLQIRLAYSSMSDSEAKDIQSQPQQNYKRIRRLRFKPFGYRR